MGVCPRGEWQGSQLLFRIIADSYESKSLILTTNLEFSKMGRHIHRRADGSSDDRPARPPWALDYVRSEELSHDARPYARRRPAKGACRKGTKMTLTRIMIDRLASLDGWRSTMSLSAGCSSNSETNPIPMCIPSRTFRSRFGNFVMLNNREKGAVSPTCNVFDPPCP